MERIDLHLHLLPGIDDGAADLAAAVAHARRMVTAGTTVATVTPHVGAPYFPAVVPEEIAARTAALQAALDEEAIPLRLLPGGELHADGTDALDDRRLHRIAQGPERRRWLLVEVPFGGLDEAFCDRVRELGLRGFGVVLAHPERVRGLVRAGGLRLLRELVLEGAAIQVNLCSLLGRNGPEVRGAATALLDARLIHVLATDAHPGRRDVTFADAVRTGLPPETLQLLTARNPAALLNQGLRPVGEVGHAAPLGGRRR